MFVEWLNKSHSLAPPNLSLLLCYLTLWRPYRSNCTSHKLQITLDPSHFLDMTASHAYHWCHWDISHPRPSSFLIHLSASSSLSFSIHSAKLLPLSLSSHLVIPTMCLTHSNDFPFYRMKSRLFSPRTLSLALALAQAAFRGSLSVLSQAKPPGNDSLCRPHPTSPCLCSSSSLSLGVLYLPPSSQIQFLLS